MPPVGTKRAVLIAVVVAQFVVPMIALLGSTPPTRFGFQMYSAQGWTKVKIYDDSGHRIAFDQSEHVAGLLRPEIDWTQRLPEHVCRSVPRAARVVVEQPEQRRDHRC